MNKNVADNRLRPIDSLRKFFVKINKRGNPNGKKKPPNENLICKVCYFPLKHKGIDENKMYNIKEMGKLENLFYFMLLLKYRE